MRLHSFDTIPFLKARLKTVTWLWWNRVIFVVITTPPDYRAASFLHLGNPLIHPQHSMPWKHFLILYLAWPRISQNTVPGMKDNCIEIATLLTESLVCWCRSYRGICHGLGVFSSFISCRFYPHVSCFFCSLCVFRPLLVPPMSY